MYYLLLLILIFLVLFRNKFDEIHQKIIAVTSLILVTTLRYGVGADYFSYNYIYLKMNPKSINSSLEIFPTVEKSFKWLNLIFKNINLSYHVFITILALLVLITVLFLIYKHSSNENLSLLLYYSMFYFVWNLSAIRQGVAIAMFTLFLFEHKKMNKLTNILILGIGFIFHASIVVPLFIYGISQFRWNRKGLSILLLFGLLFLIMPLERILRSFDGLPFFARISSYIETSSLSILSFSILIRVVIVIGLIFMYNKLTLKYPEKTTIYNFTILSIILYFVLGIAPLVGARLSVYGYFLIIFILPDILYSFNSVRIKKISLIFFLLFSFVSFSKEINAMIDQSGFIGTKVQLNKLTIFNKNIKLFNTSYSFYVDAETSNEIELDLWNKINDGSIEYQVFNDSHEHIAVYFPKENKYGIINVNGEPIPSRLEEYRFNIIENVKEIVYSTSGYKTVKYEYIDSDEPFYVNHHFDLFQKALEKELLLIDRWYAKEQHNVQDFNSNFLRKYNVENVNDVSSFTNTYYENLTYVIIKDSLGSKSFIWDNRTNDIFVAKLYDGIEPMDSKGIIKAHLGEYIEYINNEGEIIWIEHK